MFYHASALDTNLWCSIYSYISVLENERLGQQPDMYSCIGNEACTFYPVHYISQDNRIHSMRFLRAGKRTAFLWILSFCVYQSVKVYLGWIGSRCSLWIVRRAPRHRSKDIDANWFRCISDVPRSLYEALNKFGNQVSNWYVAYQRSLPYFFFFVFLFGRATCAMMTN